MITYKKPVPNTPVPSTPAPKPVKVVNNLKVYTVLSDEKFKGINQHTWMDGVDKEAIEKILEKNQIDKARAINDFDYLWKLQSNLVRMFKISTGQACNCIKAYAYGWNTEEYKMKQYLEKMAIKLQIVAQDGIEVYEKYILELFEKAPQLQDDNEFDNLVIKFFPDQPKKIDHISTQKSNTNEFEEALKASHKY